MIKKIQYDIYSDRLGPDCPFTHFLLSYKGAMRKLCSRKFKLFGANAEFRPGAYAITCSKISLGNRVVIRPGTMLFADPRDSSNGKIDIAHDVMIGSDVHIYTSNHRYDIDNKNIIDQGHYPACDVILEEGCWIGAKSVILPGVTIGKNSVIGAGSIVTKDVAPRTVVAGNPARVIKVL